MHITPSAIALFTLLATGTAFANESAQDGSQNTTDSHRQQLEDDSAHGYQNPTGVDPDPRMDDHPAPNSHEHDEDSDD
ncbi:hypothetical protein ACYCFC_10490 [Stutzerimonas sp. NM35]|uniref:hypothetical protein n=1 Tax=Stutzerimonas stutzeri TaxID=316 RepID=UPI0015E2A0A1|nr:hypothetical protein [Stutzerimonas stutzeri]MBA1264178.1 hypothetical protein [Stutzerimonas stutzeri]